MTKRNQKEFADSLFGTKGIYPENLVIEIDSTPDGQWHFATVTAEAWGKSIIGKAGPCIGTGKAIRKAVIEACK